MNNVILFSYQGDIFLVSFFKQILTFLFAFKKQLFIMNTVIILRKQKKIREGKGYFGYLALYHH